MSPFVILIPVLIAAAIKGVFAYLRYRRNLGRLFQ